MAKNKDQNSGEASKPAPAKPTRSDKSLVMTAIKAIIGCGDHDAEKKYSELKPETIKQIAELEDSGKRASIVEILYS